MYLLPDARGQGVGKALLMDLIDRAKERGALVISLETASALKEAIELYRKFGFVPSARERSVSRCDQAWELRL